MKAQTLYGAAACLISATAVAQAPTEFPSSATVAEGPALLERLSGKVFRTTDGKGQGWRLEYSSRGYLFVDIGSGYRDTGTYQVQGSQVCLEMQRSGKSCNEYRVDAQAVYLKRNNGEILTLAPR